MTIKKNNVLVSLVEQLERIHRHLRQGGPDTRKRYKHAMVRFLRFVALEFKLQKIANISNKHLAAYVAFLLANGRKETYICTELSAIRLYLDQIDGRYIITRDNQALGLGRRKGCGDRAWTSDEFLRMIMIAEAMGKTWLVDILTLGYRLGCRIHEVIRLYRVDAERALNCGNIRLKGKGGKVRYVPLTPDGRVALIRAKNRVRRGARLFVPEGTDAKVVIRHVQKFIREHREYRSGEQLTFHGLRYTDAQRHMRDCVAAGMSQRQAELQTSRRLGHNRRRITQTYTGPFK